MVNDQNNNFKPVFNANAATFTPTFDPNILNFQNSINNNFNLTEILNLPQQQFSNFNFTSPPPSNKPENTTNNNNQPETNNKESNKYRFVLAPSTKTHNLEQVQARIELFTSKTCVLLDTILRSEVEQNGGSICFKSLLENGYLVCDENTIKTAVENSVLLELDSGDKFRPKDRTITIFIREVENSIEGIKKIFEDQKVKPLKVIKNVRERKMTDGTSFEEESSSNSINNPEKVKLSSFYVIFAKTDLSSTKDIMSMTGFINKKINDGKICASVKHASKNRSALYEIVDATKLIEKRLGIECIDDYEPVKDILEHIRIGIKEQKHRLVSKEKEAKNNNTSNNVDNTSKTEKSNEPENKTTTSSEKTNTEVSEAQDILKNVDMETICSVANNLGMSVEQAITLLAPMITEIGGNEVNLTIPQNNNNSSTTTPNSSIVPNLLLPTTVPTTNLNNNPDLYNQEVQNATTIGVNSQISQVLVNSPIVPTQPLIQYTPSPVISTSQSQSNINSTARFNKKMTIFTNLLTK